MRAQIFTAPNLSRPLPGLAPVAEQECGTGAYLVVERRGTAGEETASTPAGAGRDKGPNVPPRTALSEKEVAELPF
jgi:hypothetical protein